MSRTQRSFDRVERHKPRLGHGRAFVLPPRLRLFCILDEPWRLSSVLKAILEEPDIEVRDVWIFSGEEDVPRVDPRVFAHGPGIAFVRAIQRILTSDCEYCLMLVKALRAGSVVLALSVARQDVDELVEELEAQHLHSIVYGQHWNFTAVSFDRGLQQAS